MFSSDSQTIICANKVAMSSTAVEKTWLTEFSEILKSSFNSVNDCQSLVILFYFLV